ncbi:hypothetical protein EBZ80_21755, partial [bacterium]|nr:hypothetical protein [bacterium]
MEHVFSNVLQFLIGGRSRPCPDIHAFFHHLRRHALLAELEKTSYGKRIVLDAAYATPKATGALFDLRGQCLDAMCRQVLRDKKRNYVFRTRHVFGAPK